MLKDGARKLILAGLIVLLLLIGFGVVLVTRGSSRKKHHVTQVQAQAPGAAQPAVPPGWTARRVGAVIVSVPDSWSFTTQGATGATVTIWESGPPVKGTLPTRCELQERPQWLMTFVSDPPNWLTALQQDLTAEVAATTATVGPVTISEQKPLRVAGALAALGYTSTVTDREAPAGTPHLQSADLLAAVGDGTEVHVFCSGPPGSLPPRYVGGVWSIHIVPSPSSSTTTTTATTTTTTSSTSGPATVTRTVTVGPTTSTQIASNSSNSGSTSCSNNCVVSDDGMRYQVTRTYRFTDVIGDTVVAVAFTITNQSHQSHTFDEYAGGFTAITQGGGDVPITSYEQGGDPRCYASGVEPAAPEDYTVNPGQTVTPKEQCFMVEAGQKVTEVQFLDDDAYNPANVMLHPPG